MMVTTRNRTYRGSHQTGALTSLLVGNERDAQTEDLVAAEDMATQIVRLVGLLFLFDTMTDCTGE